MKKTYILFLILFALVGYIALDIYIFSINKVYINIVESPEGCIDFHFDYKNIDGLDRVTVWEKKSLTLLWNSDLTYFLENKLRYGEVYLGTNGSYSVRKTYPHGTIPPKPLEQSKEYYIEIKYFFESFTGPASDSVVYVFKIGHDGFIEMPQSESVERWKESETVLGANSG